MSNRRPVGLLLLVATVALLAVARWLFPLAQPTIALDQRLTPDVAAEQARAFATKHGLPIDGARVAVQFDQDVETQTFIELEAGGKAAVNTEVRGRDVALFTWTVRFFRPGDPREVRVALAPDGRPLGFERTLAEADARPALDSAAALGLAEQVRREWLGEPTDRWRVVAVSDVTVQPSRRVDRTFTFERTDRRLGEAPLRLGVVVRGDMPGEARAYAKVPESFTRRYRERRADNELYANIASTFVPLFGLLGVLAMGGAARRGQLRWRPALVGGGVIGLLLAAAQVNGLPLSWFDYDTATSTGTHLLTGWLGAVVVGVAMTLVSAVLLAMGEWLTRDAFPEHFDWWQTARYAGTRPVALRLLGGYTVAAFGLAYVSVFYVVTSRGLGWWSPSGLLDDPNQIATPFPWLTAVAMSLQAGVLEEVLFRAVPLALVARAVRDRPWRTSAMALAVVGTSLVFGFAHANYPSWPAYARGVELFVEAALWAVLYLRVGLVTTIVGHFTYDLVLFGLFAAAGTALPYRITLAVVVLVAAGPALLVAWRAWRQRGLVETAPASARFAAWQGPAMPVRVAAPPPVSARVALGSASVGLAVVALALSFVPTGTLARPRFTAPRDAVAATADSVLRTLGGDPARWTRLIDAELVGAGGARRFLTANGASDTLIARLARTWLHQAQWSVRYVRTEGTVAERAEAWMIALDADGQPHTWEHTLPDSLAAPSVTREAADTLARAALAAAGAPPAALSLVSAEETARPARRDVRFTYDDTSLALPAGGAARRFAVVAGDRVVRIGHGVFIPESWSRADTEARSWRGTVGGGVLVVLVLAFAAGLVVVLRRAPSAPPVSWPRRGRLTTLLLGVGAVAAVLAANALESSLHGWDTATPWNRHEVLTWLGLLGAGLAPVGLYLLVRTADAARRRLGVAVQSASVREALVGGAVLTLAPRLVELVPALVLRFPPAATDTVLDTAVPWAADLGGVVSSGVGQAALVTLLAASAMAITRPGVRAVVLVLAALAASAATTTGAALSDADWAMRGLVTFAGIVGAVVVIWRWGRQSLEAFVVGGLLMAIVDALSAMRTAATGADASARLVSVVPAVLVLAWVLRRPRPASPVPSA